MTSSATATSDLSLLGRGSGPAQVAKPSAAAAEPAARAIAPSRARAKAFVAIVVLMALLPLLLAYDPLGILPEVPALRWTLTIDNRLSEAAADMNATGEPKVIFVGGSNLLFGINPESLSQRIDAPVLNYGLHASLGIDVIADRAGQFVRPGDVVVYAPELSHFRRSTAASFSDDLRIDFLAEHPSPNVDRRLQSFPTRDWRRIRSRCNRVRQKLERTVSAAFSPLAKSGNAPAAADGEAPGEGGSGKNAVSVYSLAAIGPRGELVAARPGPKPLERWSVSSPPTSPETMNLVDGRGVRGFELLSKVCAERGATLCVMAPMRLKVDKYDQPAVLKMEQAWLDYARANGARVLLAPAENVMDVKYGYDTDYHLNEAGVEAMEPRIAAALEPVLRAKSE